MLGLVTGAVNVVGLGIKGFLGIKEQQAQVIGTAIQTVGNMDASSAQREQSIATIIAAEANSASWLTRMWRPMVMTIFTFLIISYFFGFAPQNIMLPLPEGSAIAAIFDLLRVGLVGYIPARTVDKAVESFTRSRNLQRLLETYLDKAQVK